MAAMKWKKSPDSLWFSGSTGARERKGGSTSRVRTRIVDESVAHKT